jgi:hypothetical protein
VLGVSSTLGGEMLRDVHIKAIGSDYHQAKDLETLIPFQRSGENGRGYAWARYPSRLETNSPDTTSLFYFTKDTLKWHRLDRFVRVELRIVSSEEEAAIKSEFVSLVGFSDGGKKITDRAVWTLVVPKERAA